LTAGSHNIAATYSGDGNFAGSSSAVSQTVNKSPTTTSVTSAPNPSVYRQVVTLTATAAASGGGAGTPTGYVVFSDGGTSLGTGSLDNTGRASLSVSSLTAGSHNIAANYNGDGNFSSSSSAVSQTVNKSPTTTSVTSAPNPSAYGQAVTLTAAVTASGGAGTPTGAITFSEGKGPLGTASLDNSGRASLTVSSLTVGSHNIAATYSGDGNFSDSSAAVSQTIDKSPTTTSFKVAPNPSVFGQAVTLTASVAPSGGGAGAPSGTVTFSEGASTLGAASLDNTGQASITVSSLSVGSHNIAAAYGGDGNFSGSSSVGSETVNKSPTTTSATSAPNPSLYGQAVTLTASVTASGGGAGTPTGAVTFSEGTTPLGASSLDNTGQASITITSLSAGSHNIAATYSSDGNFSSSSSTVSQTVNKSPSTTSVTSTPNPSVYRQAVTLNASVAASGDGAGKPTGAITFSEGTTTFGSAPLDNTGKASLTVSSLTAGDHNITGSYGGDPNFMASMTSVSQTVTKSPTTTNASSTPNPSVHGQSVTFNVTVAASSGGTAVPSGTITFSEDASTLGSALLDNTGRASLTVNSLAAGTHDVTASYGGDTNFLGSTASVSQTVNKSPTTTNMTAAPNPSVFGQSVTLSIAVLPAGGGAGIGFRVPPMYLQTGFCGLLGFLGHCRVNNFFVFRRWPRTDSVPGHQR
jgi:hypothetical protein